jgi:hypothetical protein
LAPTEGVEMDMAYSNETLNKQTRRAAMQMSFLIGASFSRLRTVRLSSVKPMRRALRVAFRWRSYGIAPR